MEVLNLPFGVVVYYDYAVALIATAAMALVAFFVRQSYRAAIDEVLHDIYIFFPVIVFAVIQGLRLGTASQAEFYADLEHLMQVAYSTKLAAGKCLANIQITPFVQSYGPEAEAKMSMADVAFNMAYILPQFYAGFYIAMFIAQLFAPIGYLLMIRFTRTIGAAMLAFAIALPLGYYFAYQVIHSVAQSVGNIEVYQNYAVITFPQNNPCVVKELSQYAQPGSTVRIDFGFAVSAAQHCDNVIGAYACAIAPYMALVSASFTIFIMLTFMFYEGFKRLFGG